MIASATVILFLGQQAIPNAAISMAIFLFLAMFLELPRYSNYWIIMAIGLYFFTLTIRVFSNVFKFTFILSDVVGLYLILPLFLLSIGILCRYVSMYLNNVLMESETAMEKLNQKNIDLITIQAELKESEEKYREAFEIANFYKDLFAHDINNILNVILSSSALSTMYLNEPESQNEIKEMLNLINDQVKRGTSLISNVRKLSELEKSVIPTQSTEACEFLNNSIVSLKKGFQVRDINIQVDSVDKKILVQANNLLEDVFGNILNNAVKYNDTPLVEILIKYSKEQRDEINYIKFEFIDNGIGVLDNQKNIIFKEGYKNDKGVRGMGFGLSLVKKIIESYNGQIWVEDRIKNDYTKGSNFIILIPKAEKN